MKWINASALAQFDDLPTSAYVRLPVLKAMFGVSASTIWRWSRVGWLPRPTKISGTTLWRVGELRERLAQASREPPSTDDDLTADSPSAR